MVRYKYLREVENGIEKIILIDNSNAIQVTIIPEIGNNLISLQKNEQEFIWFPFSKLSDFKKNPILCGIPFLAPWGNRIDGDTYYINGKKYTIPQNIPLRDENNLPLHGIYLYSRWEVVSVTADIYSASVNCILSSNSEAVNFPLSHTYEMSYILSERGVEIKLRIINSSAENFPVAVGFHPYLQLPKIPREDWVLEIPAKYTMQLDERLLPNGKKEENSYKKVKLGNLALDHIFTDIISSSRGNSCKLYSRNQGINIRLGENYPIVIIYAPPEQNFICIEPMAAPTNSFNLYTKLFC